MITILSATCEGNAVKVEGHPVTNPAPIILTKGTGASTGVLFIKKDFSVYVAMNTTDLSTFLEKVAQALGILAGSLTEIAAAVGSMPLIASMAAKSAQLSGIQSELTTLKGNLK